MGWLQLILRVTSFCFDLQLYVLLTRYLHEILLGLPHNILLGFMMDDYIMILVFSVIKIEEEKLQ